MCARGAKGGLTRRDFIHRTAAASAALALEGTLHSAAAAKETAGEVPLRPRNVLFLMTDEHNVRCLSGMGHRHALTPNLDRLADNGVFFENALCAYPVCTASRGTIHTGMWPHTNGVHLNVDPDPHPTDGLAADTTLMATVFHDHGYKCYHHGKWHLGDVKRHSCYNWKTPFGSFPREDYLPALREYRRTHSVPKEMPEGARNVWGWPLYETPRMRKFHEEHPKLPYAAGRWELPLEISETAFITDQALKSMDESVDQSFMITWSDPGPHGPHTIQDPYYSRTDPADIDYPANLARPDYYRNDPSCQSYDYMGEEGVREYLRCYFGKIMRIDDQIGRLIERLEQTGRLEDTLIVFMADHGDMCGAHQTAGGKAIWCFYDEIVRVPFLMHWPRGIKGGRRVKTMASGVDLMPTILDYAGLHIPAQCQGESLRRFIEGEEDTDRLGFCEATHPHAAVVRRMISTHEWKLWIYYGGPLSQEVFRELRPTVLYHLTEDPGEEHNLADEPAYAKVRKELLGELVAWMRRTEDPWLERLPKLI